MLGACGICQVYLASPPSEVPADLPEEVAVALRGLLGSLSLLAPVSLVSTVSSTRGLPNLSNNCERLALTFWWSESDLALLPLTRLMLSLTLSHGMKI